MIGIIGVGDMGLPMSGHMVARGFDVVAYDVDPDRLAAAAAGGAKPASGLSEMAQKADIFVACLRTDDQMEAVAEELVAHGRPGQLSWWRARTAWISCGDWPASSNPRDCGSSMRPSSSARWAPERETCCRCAAVKRPTSNARDR